MKKIIDSEAELFAKFAAACAPILNAGFEHAADENLDRMTWLTNAIDDERARPRLVVTWDRLYCTVAVDAIGVTNEGEEVSMPIFEYRMHRETTPGAH